MLFSLSQKYQGQIIGQRAMKIGAERAQSTSATAIRQVRGKQTPHFHHAVVARRAMSKC